MRWFISSHKSSTREYLIGKIDCAQVASYSWNSCHGSTGTIPNQDSKVIGRQKRGPIGRKHNVAILANPSRPTIHSKPPKGIHWSKLVYIHTFVGCDELLIFWRYQKIIIALLCRETPQPNQIARFSSCNVSIFRSQQPWDIVNLINEFGWLYQSKLGAPIDLKASLSIANPRNKKEHDNTNAMPGRHDTEG